MEAVEQQLPLIFRTSSSKTANFVIGGCATVFCVALGTYWTLAMPPQAATLVLGCGGLFAVAVGLRYIYWMAYKLFREDTLLLSKEGMTLTQMGRVRFLPWHDIEKAGSVVGSVLMPPQLVIVLRWDVAIRYKQAGDTRGIYRDTVPLGPLWDFSSRSGVGAMKRLIDDCVRRYS